MLIYRFKITSEEHEDFLREICIQPSQTFADFHSCLMETAVLLPCGNASFFLTDNKQRKNREISLSPVEREVKRFDQELDEMVMETIVPVLMKNAKVKDFIEDPHQRLIYEYHGKEYFTFLVELVKIMKSDNEGFYPSCTKWEGEIPKKKETLVADPEEKAEQSQPDLVKSVVTGIDALSKLEGIEENEEELAEIENNLSDILFGDSTEKNRDNLNKDPVLSDVEVDDLDEDGEDKDDKEDFSDGMEHLEDIEDIENIEIKYSKSGDETNDE